VVTYTNTTQYSTNFVYITNSVIEYVTNTHLRTTGQLYVVAPEDDGDLHKGTAWPNPRFTIGTVGEQTNWVTDNMTGLVWNRSNNTNQSDWDGAIEYCNALISGGTNDWRMPNVLEAASLMYFGQKVFPHLPNTAGEAIQTIDGDPFFNLQFLTTNTSQFWTSTTVPGDTVSACVFTPRNANMGGVLKVHSYFVWPVRGGN
jgi:hypothetical protein